MLCGGAIYLEAHYNQHTDIFPFKCSFCTKRFNSRKKLNCHIPHCIKAQKSLSTALNLDTKIEVTTEGPTDTYIPQSVKHLEIQQPADYNSIVDIVLKDAYNGCPADLDETQTNITPKACLNKLSKRLNEETPKQTKGMNQCNL